MTKGKKLKIIIQLLISFLIGYIFYRYIDFSKLADTMRKINIYMYILIIPLFIFACVINVFKWKLIISVWKKNVDFLLLLKFYMYTFFYNLFLPGSNSSDILRTIIIKKHLGSYSIAIGSIFMERFTGMVSLAFFSLISALFFPLPKFPQVLTYTIIFSSLLIIIIFFILTLNIIRLSFIEYLLKKILKANKLREKILNFFGAILLHNVPKKNIYIALFIGLLSQSIIIYLHYLIGISINCVLPFYAYLIAVPLSAFLKLIPLTINSFGVREGVFMYLFGFFGQFKEESILVGFISFSIQIFTGIFMGLIHIFDKELAKKD